MSEQPNDETRPAWAQGPEWEGWTTELSERYVTKTFWGKVHAYKVNIMDDGAFSINDNFNFIYAESPADALDRVKYIFRGLCDA